MTKHLSKEELKKADTFLQEGRKAFFAFEKYHNQIGVGLGIFAILVAGILFFNHSSDKKETELQTQFYKIEKSYLKKKEANETKLNAEKDPKTKDVDGKLADSKKADEGKKSQEVQLESYDSEVEQFTKLIQENPKTMAASMSALVVTEILSEAKKFEEAQKLLDLVYSKSKGHSVTRALVGNTLGAIEANLGKCDKALSIWESMIKDKNLEYMSLELQLRSALCQAQLGQTQKAEELLLNLKAKPETMQGRVAEKYLRLLNLKKQGS